MARSSETLPGRTIFVSVSVRIAEPGYGPEMVADYEDVFGGFR